MIVAATHDNICPHQVAVELQKLSSQVQLVTVATCEFPIATAAFHSRFVLMFRGLVAHFELYGHKESVDAMTSFLAKYAPLV